MRENEDDFEDDYTAVAEDVFDALREDSTGEIEDDVGTAEIDIGDLVPHEPEDRTVDSEDIGATVADTSQEAEDVIDGSTGAD